MQEADDRKEEWGERRVERVADLMAPKEEREAQAAASKEEREAEVVARKEQMEVLWLDNQLARVQTKVVGPPNSDAPTVSSHICACFL